MAGPPPDEDALPALLSGSDDEDAVEDAAFAVDTDTDMPDLAESDASSDADDADAAPSGSSSDDAAPLQPRSGRALPAGANPSSRIWQVPEGTDEHMHALGPAPDVDERGAATGAADGGAAMMQIFAGPAGGAGPHVVLSVPLPASLLGSLGALSGGTGNGGGAGRGASGGRGASSGRSASRGAGNGGGGADGGQRQLRQAMESVLTPMLQGVAAAAVASGPGGFTFSAMPEPAPAAAAAAVAVAPAAAEQAAPRSASWWPPWQLLASGLRLLQRLVGGAASASSAGASAATASAGAAGAAVAAALPAPASAAAQPSSFALPGALASLPSSPEPSSPVAGYAMGAADRSAGAVHGGRRGASQLRRPLRRRQQQQQQQQRQQQDEEDASSEDCSPDSSPPWPAPAPVWPAAPLPGAQASSSSGSGSGSGGRGGNRNKRSRPWSSPSAPASSGAGSSAAAAAAAPAPAALQPAGAPTGCAAAAMGTGEDGRSRAPPQPAAAAAAGGGSDSESLPPLGEPEDSDVELCSSELEPRRLEQQQAAAAPGSPRSVASNASMPGLVSEPGTDSDDLPELEAAASDSDDGDAPAEPAAATGRGAGSGLARGFLGGPLQRSGWSGGERAAGAHSQRSDEGDEDEDDDEDEDGDDWEGSSWRTASDSEVDEEEDEEEDEEDEEDDCQCGECVLRRLTAQLSGGGLSFATMVLGTPLGAAPGGGGAAAPVFSRPRSNAFVAPGGRAAAAAAAAGGGGARAAPAPPPRTAKGLPPLARPRGSQRGAAADLVPADVAAARVRALREALSDERYTQALLAGLPGVDAGHAAVVASLELLRGKAWVLARAASPVPPGAARRGRRGAAAEANEDRLAAANTARAKALVRRFSPSRW
ncbi:hypothetical protein HT031_000523 [Scenedesmus sp. PABB004]|nr:hypothetical protein HT031_000523 [Scenedesmus sp. PABB004]